MATCTATEGLGGQDAAELREAGIKTTQKRLDPVVEH